MSEPGSTGGYITERLMRRVCPNCAALLSDFPGSICIRCGWKPIEKAIPSETVNHPPHYGGDTIYEAIKVIEAWDLDFHLGNTVKYLARAGKKGDALEDLKKARWYLDRKIAAMEKA